MNTNNYELKIYDLLGLNTRHIETIDRLYGSVIDQEFNLSRQPKRIKEIIRHLRDLPQAMRPKFIFESSIVKPGRRLKSFAEKVLTAGRKHKNH